MSRSFLVVAGLAFLAGGCGDGTGPGGRALRPELIRLPGSGAATAVAALSLSPRSGYLWSSAIAIASFRSPVRSIELRGPASYAIVYVCPADSNDGCLVDLAGPALQDLLAAAPVTIPTGTYNEVDISTCREEGGYHTLLTGAVVLGGVTYNTRTVGVLDTAGPAEPVQLEYAGCSRAYPLPNPLVVVDSAGAPVSLKLYFDIRDVAWASLGGLETANGWIPGGCAGPRPGAPETGGVEIPFLCTGYPDIAGVVDNQLPTLERYRINGAATFGLIFQASDGKFVGGFSRRYFEEGAAATPGFNADTPVSDFVDNGDGTYRLATWGGWGPGGSTAHYFDAPAFQRANHSGMAVAQDLFPFIYNATRLE